MIKNFLLLLIAHTTCYSAQVSYGETKKTYRSYNQHRNTTHNGSLYFTALKEQQRQEDAQRINNHGILPTKKQTTEPIQQKTIPGLHKQPQKAYSSKK
jgi:hypothetical protein